MQHTARTLFMVEPTTFGFDEDTAATNPFQHRPQSTAAHTATAAQREFQAFVATLRRHDIGVVVFQDTAEPPKPDAVFPNNWLSTWADGRVFVYPMEAPSRRPERSTAALDELRKRFRIADVIDLSAAEQVDSYLEGTGAMVFDHAHQYAYASISPRCDEQLFRAHAAKLGYTPVIFHSFDQAGIPIYHTNVLCSVQQTTAVLCLAAITDSTERAHVVATLQRTGHEIIDITFPQLDQFCGNVLEVQNARGETFLILSQSAYDAFTPAERALLGRHNTLLPMDIPTIEAVGGGGARCMVAEIFLPPKM